jgi:hypothetical protein
MSLTALVHEKLPELRFIEWFKDPKFSLEYPKGPVVMMTRNQFEQVGLDFVRLHFRNYEDLRLESQESANLFETADDKKLLKKHVPVIIKRHYETGNLAITPCTFRQYHLGGLIALDRDLFPEASVPFDCGDEEFIRAFDAVAAESG